LRTKNAVNASANIPRTATMAPMAPEDMPAELCDEAESEALLAGAEVPDVVCETPRLPDCPGGGEDVGEVTGVLALGVEAGLDTVVDTGV